MSSLADLQELVGFFSYSRRDDQHSDGALSRLRARIQGELRLQLGRDFRLWQDTAAIPEGALWEDEIKRAVAESAFFIPIVTPSAISSTHCRFEFSSFLAREAALGRSNLIFPLLYVRVPALEREAEWRQDDVLKIIGTRQYCNWLEFRHRDLREPEVSKKMEFYCNNIVEALRQPWISREERQAAEEAEARLNAEKKRQAREEERRRQEADAQARAGEAEARERAEAAARRKREAEEEQRVREAEERERAEAAARRKRQAGEEQRAREAEERERREREQQASRQAEIEARQRAKAERRAEQAARVDAGSSTAAWNHPALIMPLAGAVLFIILFAIGLWNTSAIGRYFIVPVVLGALFAFSFWHYGRADLTKSIFAGAILWAVTAALSLEVTFIFAPAFMSLSPAARNVASLFHGLAFALVGAVAVMAVGSWLCPILRNRLYWIIALVLWPAISLATSGLAPAFLSLTGATGSTLMDYFFLAYVVKLMVELGCVGFWLSRAAVDKKPA
jgi:hypothetical protein